MKFSLAHLLLLFLAWALAYNIAPYATLESALISYRHDNTAADIRGIRLWAASCHDTNPNRTIDEYDLTRLWADMGRDCDSWGNRFQIVERKESGVFGMQSPLHVFSFGVDGKSDSKGNDPDDINSWNYDRNTYYGRQITNEFKRKFAWRTLWLTPIIFFPLYLIVQNFTKRQRVAR